MIPRRCQGPLQELYRVVEPEHVIVVLNVVLREQLVHLLSLRPVHDIHVDPAEPVWKRVWLRLNIGDSFPLIDRLVQL